MNYYFGDSDYTIHVDDANGNDTNDGKSFANAKKTIAGANGALNAVPNGGIIIIWPGTYTEKVDIATAAKQISIVGTNRYKCKITQSANDTIVLNEGCTLQNLTIEQTGNGKAVDGTSRHNCKFIDCSIFSTGIDALYCVHARNIQVQRCYIKSAYDTLLVGDRYILENCILVTTGLYTGTGRAVALGSSPQYRGVVRNSILVAQPSFENDGPGASLYQTERNLYCIYEGGKVSIRNCILVVEGYKYPFANANSYAKGNSFCIYNTKLTVSDCILFSRTDQNQANTIAYGLYQCDGQMNNSNLEVIGTSASYDFASPSSKTIYLVNTKYKSDQIDVNVTVNAVPAGIAFEKAAKSLINKAIQNKITGAIDYYDDDSQTILFTHMPIDNESNITRTPI